MTGDAEFAYYRLYSDYSGITFFGAPIDGLWQDRLEISDHYIAPLFKGVLDRRDESELVHSVPRLIREWNEVVGWMAADDPVSVPRSDAAELVDALSRLIPTDIAPHSKDTDDVVRCATVICESIASRLSRGEAVFIEQV